MRAIQTFVLRLFVDSAEPQALRGSLYSIAHGDAYTFADRGSLLELLDQLTRLAEGQIGPADSEMQTQAGSGYKEGVGNG
jgi:hypothetical protein